jgi:hypothetical protein
VTGDLSLLLVGVGLALRLEPEDCIRADNKLRREAAYREMASEAAEASEW